MGAAMAIMILWAVLLAVPPARADQIAFADPPMPVTEGLAHDTLPNIIQASTIGPNAPLDRKGGYEPLFSNKIQDTLGKTARLSSDSRVGFQWALNGKRPSLEYRFTDNEKMQFRPSRHGARVVAVWTF